MPDQESEIQKLESEFPPVSGQAFADARAGVLASGQSVLQAEGGFIYRVFPDGRKELVKQIEPPTAVTPGTETGSVPSLITFHPFSSHRLARGSQ